MVFDDMEPYIDQRRFKQVGWGEFYPEAAEPMPPNMPAPRGRSVVTSCFVDAVHAGCRVTRRSHTGVLIDSELSSLKKGIPAVVRICTNKKTAEDEHEIQASRQV
jgi:hypothetical protein